MLTPKDEAKNELLLKVSGEKIAPPKKTTTKKTYSYYNQVNRVDEPRENKSSSKKDPIGECDRPVLELKKTHVKNTDVCSQQLRQIRETVEVEDFQRLLKRLNVTPAAQSKKKNARTKRNAIVGGVNVSNVYKEFFQDHYDLLRDVISRTRTRTTS